VLTQPQMQPWTGALPRDYPFTPESGLPATDYPSRADVRAAGLEGQKISPSGRKECLVVVVRNLLIMVLSSRLIASKEAPHGMRGEVPRG
jgi:hypothetical protein